MTYNLITLNIEVKNMNEKLTIVYNRDCSAHREYLSPVVKFKKTDSQYAFFFSTTFDCADLEIVCENFVFHISDIIDLVVPFAQIRFVEV